MANSQIEMESVSCWYYLALNLEKTKLRLKETETGPRPLLRMRCCVQESTLGPRVRRWWAGALPLHFVWFPFFIRRSFSRVNQEQESRTQRNRKNRFGNTFGSIIDPIPWGLVEFAVLQHLELWGKQERYLVFDPWLVFNQCLVKRVFTVIC